MTWNAFLNHPDVVSYHLANPGQYLFLKALHEVAVGCFTYLQWESFLDNLPTSPGAAESDKQAIQFLNASPFRRWYDTCLPQVRRWQAHLKTLQARYGEQVDADTVNWSTQISALADVIDDITRIHQEAHTLIVPKNERAQEILDWVRGSVDRIQFMHQAIREHEYISIYEYPGTSDTEGQPL